MKTFIYLGLVLVPQLLWANTVLLVTDIDDTIKVSHVLDKNSMVANTIATRNAFMGMPELYQALVKLPGAHPMQYLSNAPEWLMKRSHAKFVRINEFPEGVLVLSKKTFAKNHKVDAIREMIKKYAPTSMILIGDNGEKDNEVYDQIRREFPSIAGHTYIHLAYSLKGYKGSVGKPLLKEQLGFATSIDLANDMFNKGYINSADYFSVVKTVEERALAENPRVERNRQMLFPAWFDCRDYVVPVLPVITPEFQNKMIARCSRGPIDD